MIKRAFAAFAALLFSFSAIAGSINSGIVFGPLYVTGQGTFNSNANPLPPSPAGTQFIIGNADSSITRFVSYSFNAQNVFTSTRANGTNLVPTALNNGDLIIAFNTIGYKTTTYSTASASLTFSANENWTDSATGSIAKFLLTPNGTTTQRVSFQFNANSHLGYGSITTPPTISTCGTGASVTGNSDNGFIVTVGTGGVATSCVVNFGATYLTNPACIVQNDTDIVAYKISTSTTQVTATAALAFTAGSKLYFVCVATGAS